MAAFAALVSTAHDDAHPAGRIRVVSRGTVAFPRTASRFEPQGGESGAWQPCLLSAEYFPALAESFPIAKLDNSSHQSFYAQDFTVVFIYSLKLSLHNGVSPLSLL